MKRFAALALLAASALFAQAQPLPIQPPQTANITTINSTPTATCSSGSCVYFGMEGQSTAQIQLGGTAWTASGGLSAQVTTDGNYWVTLSKGTTFTRLACSSSCTSATIPSGTTNEIYQLSAECTAARACRITALGAVTGSAAVLVRTSPISLGGGSGGTVTGGTDGVGQASTTSGQSGVLVQCATTTGAPTYTTGTTNPCSTDTTGALRVNVVAGGAGGGAVTQSGTWSTRTQDGSGNALTSAARGSERALSVQIVDASGAQVTSFGGGSGGTVSGTTAHDAAATSVNPVLIGGYSSAAAPTNVSADGDAVRAWYLRSGAVVNQQSFGGVLASAGSGTNGTGVQRVTVATDDTLVASLATKLDTLHTDIVASNTQLPSALGPQATSASLSIVPATSSTFTLGAGSATIGALTANQSVNVAQINGVTPLMGAGNAGTGSARVTVSTDQAALPTHGHGATGSTAPTNATLAGAKSGANMVAITQGSTTAKIDTASAATAELVALTSSQQIRVTALSVIAGGTGTIKFVYGTGTNCGTGTTDLTGAYPLVANAGLSLGGGLGPVIVVPASQALCITTTGSVQMSGHVTYAKYTD